MIFYWAYLKSAKRSFGCGKGFRDKDEAQKYGDEQLIRRNAQGWGFTRVEIIEKVAPE